MGTTKLAAILCLAVVAPAGADDHAPHSLRMRPSPPARIRPLQLGLRVAQVPPDPSPDDAPDGPPPSADTTPPSADTPPPSPDTPPSTNTPPPSADTPPPSADTPPPAPSAVPRAQPPLPDDGKTEVISVTGSTIEHKLFNGRAPVTVVTRADIAASGRATLGDILQALPVQSNAGNAQVNAEGDGTTRINLRGLGARRTLVLLNGRRIVNGGPGADSAVDVNAIPLAMIERVEILKDGASAIYGADAVGGVVNLITRPRFDGTDVALLASTSQRGDGIEYDASFVTGFTSSDKWTYLVMSGGYQGHQPVLASDRAFSSVQKSYNFARKTETRNASLAAPDGRLDVSSIGTGGIQPPGCVSAACKPDGNGGWTDFLAPRDLYNDAAGNYLYTPSERFSLFGTGVRRVNDHLALLVEVQYLRRNHHRQLSPVAFVADNPISKDSIYNPFGSDILDYRRRITELGPRQFLDDVTATRFVLGFTGEVPESLGVLENWKYEFSYNFGHTKSLVATTGQLLKPRLRDALGPSMIDSFGEPICVRTPGDPTTKIIYIIGSEETGIRIPCVPLNLLVPAGSIPSGQLENVTYRDAGTGSNTLRTLLFTAGGRVAELPNRGDISLSLGGNYRDEVGSQIPPELAGLGYTTDNTERPTDGQFEIVEGFGELAVVPISGHDIAQRVELDLGARAMRHSRHGSRLTYKAGGLFRTVHGIAVRSTYATAFRAPTVPELVGGRFEHTPFAEDPCDIKPPSVADGTKDLAPAIQAACEAQGVPAGSSFHTGQQISVTGGNPDLKAETAATATIGAVVEPPRLKGLAFSADYWHIRIDNAIETLGLQTIFANCYERNLPGYCDQIHRDPATHRISSVDQFLQNVTRTTTSGIDIALRYDTELAELGRIHARLEAQYLLHYDLQTSLQVIHGVGVYDLGVYPRYKANLLSNWIHPRGASAGFNLRYVGNYKECAANNCNNEHNLSAASREVDRYFKLDLFGGYDLRSRLGKTTVQAGVNNLFDAAPPTVYNAAAANSDAATYDFVGRMVYLRLSQLF